MSNISEFSEESRWSSLYYQIPDKVFSDPNLSDKAKLLYVLLSGYARENGECWPSDAHLAKKLNMVERSIQRILLELERQNYISRRLESSNDPFRKNRFIEVHTNFKKCLPNDKNVVRGPRLNVDPEHAKMSGRLSKDIYNNISNNISPIVPKGDPPSLRKKSLSEPLEEKAPEVRISKTQEIYLLKKCNDDKEKLMRCYQKLSDWKIGEQITGGKNDYLAIIKWVLNAVEKEKTTKTKQFTTTKDAMRSKEIELYLKANQKKIDENQREKERERSECSQQKT